MARVAIYLRVSTDQQTTDNQRLELTAWAERCGHTVVETFEDRAISGAKTSAERPSLRALLKDVVRRRFDLVAVWSIDRLGRSLQDLTATLGLLQSAKVDFFSHQQAIDTTTSAGKAMFVNAGIARVRATGKTKSGKAIGRPRVPVKTLEAARTALAAPGASIRTVAAATGLSAGKISQIRAEMNATA